MEHYPFMSRNDGTEITFSDVKIKNSKNTVTVYFERWSKEHDDFDSMQIDLPDGVMERVVGYSEKEVDYYAKLVSKYFPLFVKFANQKGVGERA